MKHDKLPNLKPGLNFLKKLDQKEEKEKKEEPKATEWECPKDEPDEAVEEQQIEVKVKEDPWESRSFKTKVGIDLSVFCFSFYYFMLVYLRFCPSVCRASRYFVVLFMVDSCYLEILVKISFVHY